MGESQPLAQQARSWWIVLQNMDTLAFVCDSQTREVVFANQRAEDMFGPMVGKPCWDAIHNSREPCGICGAHALEEDTAVMCRWEKYSQRAERWFDYRARRVRWSDGRWMRLQTAVDITEQVATRRRLLEMQQELTRERRLLRTVIDNLPSAIYVKDDARRNVLANKARLLHMGLEKEAEVLGKTNQELFPQHLAVRAEEQDLQVLKTGVPVRDTLEKVKLPSGKKRWLLVSKLPLYDEHDELTGLVGIEHDVTEQKVAVDELQKVTFYDKLTGLYNRGYCEEELRRLDTARQLPLAMIMTDMHGLKLVNDALGDAAGNELLKAMADVLRSVCRPEDLVARWAGDDFLILLPQTNEMTVREVMERILSACRDTSQQRQLPLLTAVGCAVRKTAAEPLAAVREQAEAALRSHKLATEAESRQMLVRSLHDIVQARTWETPAHIRQLRQLTAVLARQLGLGEQTMRILARLAELHDVGMVAVDPDLLQKTEPLTPYEWQQIRSHPEIGYRIVAAAPDYAEAADAVLAHHEHWDGRGYPRGLAGEAIPLTARILAVVDAYDVMTTGRPYRKALAPAAALKQITAGAGKQFDADLARLLVQAVEAGDCSG